MQVAYLVEWDGLDTANKQPWPPSWQPVQNIDDVAVKSAFNKKHRGINYSACNCKCIVCMCNDEAAMAVISNAEATMARKRRRQQDGSSESEAQESNGEESEGEVASGSGDDGKDSQCTSEGDSNTLQDAEGQGEVQSEYEQRRQLNIINNQQYLQQLGLGVGLVRAEGRGHSKKSRQLAVCVALLVAGAMTCSMCSNVQMHLKL